MKILETNVYLGPNKYAHFPVIRHVIDLGILEEWPTGKLGGKFINELLDRLPGLYEHGCSYREKGGFTRRLKEDEGTWLGHVSEHVTLELQNVAGSDVTFGKTRSVGEKGQYNLVYEYKQRDVGLEAGRLAMAFIIDLLPEKLKSQIDGVDPEFNFEESRDDFIRFAQRFEFGPSTASLVNAGRDREIPFIRLNEYSLVQFGHGKYQKRIQATVTVNTSNIGVDIASDKELTNTILGDLGLPVPKQRMARTPERAIRAARHIGYPVVLKPLNANHGRGISINLTTEDEVKTAFDKARQHGSSRTILVEKYVSGMDHRMLVIDNKLVAVAKRVPGHVMGDGAHTIQELVDMVNSDPNRGIGHEKVLTKIHIDGQAERILNENNLTLESVIKKGEILYLRLTANLSTGGTAIDMTDVVHPDNKEMAERAVKAVGLDIGGVDFLTDDITQSYKTIGGAIVEVNAGPGFRMHVAPSEGDSRDVAGHVMDMLFPPGTPTRIPIASITGTNGKTTTTRMVAHILKTAGHVVGFTSTDGVYIDGRLSVKGDMTGAKSAQMVLRDPDVDMAVLETARGGLIRSGMGYGRCNVGACLNVSEDHLGLSGIESVEELAEVKRVVVEVATDVAVLNADDINCLKMADHTKASRICYVTANPNHSLVKEHIQEGGLAVVLEKGINGDMITLYENATQIPLLWTHLIPSTLKGKAMHNVQNSMFAAAISYGLGKSLEDVRHGLRTFDSTFFQTPGRMNVFDDHPFKVILDYAHNPDAVKMMCDVVRQLETQGRKICVISAPGDRRDEDIKSIAEIAAEHFDYFICRADDNRRKRGNDEVPKIMRDALKSSGVKEEAIEVIPDEVEAIEKSLHFAKENDLLLIFGDNITRCWKQIIHFKPEGGEKSTVEKSERETFSEEVLEYFSQKDGENVIRDERGVRLAKEESD